MAEYKIRRMFVPADGSLHLDDTETAIGWTEAPTGYVGDVVIVLVRMNSRG